MDNHWLGLYGLEELASGLIGNERIGFGIRPHGFHAGNLTSIVAYPWMLCEHMEQKNRDPKFNFHCWINDIESPVLVGPDGTRKTLDLANMLPGGKTFQCLEAPNGFQGNLADYWQPLITNAVSLIQKKFPKTTVAFHRTSELTDTYAFRRTVLGAMKDADDVAHAIGQYLGQPVYKPHEFMEPVCPSCESPVSGARVTADELIEASCSICDTKTTAMIRDFRWWSQFRMLSVPRMADGFYDVWIMGMDHFNENSSGLRSALARIFGVDGRSCNFLYAPLIQTDKDVKMGKSNHNVSYISLKSLLRLLKDNYDWTINLTNAPTYQDIRVLGKILPRHIAGLSLSAPLRLLWNRVKYSLSDKPNEFRRDNAVRNRIQSSSRELAKFLHERAIRNTGQGENQNRVNGRRPYLVPTGGHL